MSNNNNNNNDRKSSSSPLLKIPFIQRILLYAHNHQNPHQIVNYPLVHPSWYETLYEFKTQTWIWENLYKVIKSNGIASKSPECDYNVNNNEEIVDAVDDDHTGSRRRNQFEQEEAGRKLVQQVSAYFLFAILVLLSSDYHLDFLRALYNWIMEKKIQGGPSFTINNAHFSFGYHHPSYAVHHSIGSVSKDYAAKVYPNTWKMYHDSESFFHFSPLHVACHYGQHETIDFLIETVGLSLVDGAPIFITVKNNDIKTTKKLLELFKAGRAKVAAQMHKKNTEHPLPSSVSAVQPNFTASLSTHSRDQTEYYPLHYACENGNAEMVRLLLDDCNNELPRECPRKDSKLEQERRAGCSRSRTKTRRYIRMSSSLVYLCIKSASESGQYYGSGSTDYDYRTSSATTRQHQNEDLKVWRKGAECLSIILAAGASPDRFTDTNYSSMRNIPALECCRWGNFPALEVLIREGKIDINDQRLANHSLLFEAVENRSDKCVEVLVNAGASVCQASDHDHETPLFCLVKKAFDEEYGKLIPAFRLVMYQKIVKLLLPLPTSSEKHINDGDEVGNEKKEETISLGQVPESQFSVKMQDDVLQSILTETKYGATALSTAIKNMHFGTATRMIDFIFEVQKRRRERDSPSPKTILSAKKIENLMNSLKSVEGINKHKVLASLKKLSKES